MLPANLCDRSQFGHLKMKRIDWKSFLCIVTVQWLFHTKLLNSCMNRSVLKQQSLMIKKMCKLHIIFIIHLWWCYFLLVTLVSLLLVSIFVVFVVVAMCLLRALNIFLQLVPLRADYFFSPFLYTRTIKPRSIIIGILISKKNSFWTKEQIFEHTGIAVQLKRNSWNVVIFILGREWKKIYTAISKRIGDCAEFCTRVLLA